MFYQEVDTLSKFKYWCIPNKTGAKTLWSPMCGTVTCDACGGVSGNSGGGGASGGGSCNLTLDATVCNGNFPLKLLLALIPGDFKFISGHLRGYYSNNIWKNWERIN